MLRKHAKKLVSFFQTSDYETLNRIELSKDNILHNIEYIKVRHPNFSMMPVLKANAYGHGLIEIATILNEADCSFLVVDSYYEAAKILNVTKHKILVLGYIKPQNVRLLNTKKCSFVVQDPTCLEAFGQLKKPVNIHMELNTGMNRLGLSTDEIEAYLETLSRYPNLHLEGVMTHLADADNAADNAFTNQQVQMFDEAVKRLRNVGITPRYIHVAQTGGSPKAVSTHANGIRLGIGLYGVNPLQQADPYFSDLAGLKPVLELKTTVIKIIDLKKDDRVSYNGIFIAPHAMKIGVLPIGYYEGVPRELGNEGMVTFGGQTLHIVGKICMNHTMIALDNTVAEVGDTITVISRDGRQPNSVASICKRHEIFNYLLITKLSSSIRRVII